MRVCSLAALLFLTACPRSPRPELSAAGFDPAALVPAQSIAVGYLDAPTLLARPGLKEEGALVQQVVEKIRAELGIDPALLRGATLFYAPMPGETLPQRGGAILPGAVSGSPGFGALGASIQHAGN